MTISSTHHCWLVVFWSCPFTCYLWMYTSFSSNVWHSPSTVNVFESCKSMPLSHYSFGFTMWLSLGLDSFWYMLSFVSFETECTRWVNPCMDICPLPILLTSFQSEFQRSCDWDNTLCFKIVADIRSFFVSSERFYLISMTHYDVLVLSFTILN